MTHPQLGIYKNTVAPTDTAISLAEVKSHLKISASTEDTYLTNLISVATEMVQNYTGQVLMPTTQSLKLPYFINRMDIQRVPVKTVVITYYDSDNSSSVLASTDYEALLTLSSTDSPVSSTIIAASGVSFPDTYPRMDAVTITFTSGYADADDVPMAIKQAMLLIIGQLFLNRADMVYKLPVLSGYLLNPYKIAVI